MINIPYTINQSKEFINVALKYFGIKDAVRITISRSKCPKCNVDMELKGRFLMWRCPSCNKKVARIYPDIWCEPHSTPKTITVTGEWARQNKREREKRLVHEMLHFIGMEHNNAIGYITYPNKDRYSHKVYNKLMKNFEAAKRGKISFKRNEITTTKQLRMMNPFPKVWSGVVDLRDGVVEETFTYDQAKAKDFHHGDLISAASYSGMYDGIKAYFWIDKNGYIRTWGSDYLEFPDNIEDKIRQQLHLPHRRNLPPLKDVELANWVRYPRWGNPFPKVWSGVVDLRDGYVEETFTYEQAKDGNFHHSRLVSHETDEQIKAGEKAYFWVDTYGGISSWIGQNRIPPDIKDSIQKQIGIKVGSDYTSGVMYRCSTLPEDSSHWAIANPFPKGKPWSGVVDLRDGFVEETYTYRQAKEGDFHHGNVVSRELNEEIYLGNKAYFWIGQYGEIRGWEGQTQITPDIERKVQKQLGIKPNIQYRAPERKSEWVQDRNPRSNPNATGLCYVNAYHFVREHKNDGCILVHGTVFSNELSRRIKHAWVEIPGNYIVDGQILKVFDSGVYKGVFRPIAEHKYTADEALMSMVKHPEGKRMHLGPWENPCPDVTFTLDPRPSVKNYMLISVDIDKFDKLWSTDNCYIDRTGKGKTGDRLNMFKEFLATGKTIEAPIVEFSEYRNGISFTNGRHRFCTFRDMGCKRTVVSIDKKEYNRFKELVDAVPVNDFAILRGGK